MEAASTQPPLQQLAKILQVSPDGDTWESDASRARRLSSEQSPQRQAFNQLH